MSFYRLCGICILLGVLAITAKEGGGRFAPLIGLSGGIFLLSHAISRYGEVIGLLSSFSDNELFSSLLSLALRIVALCILTEVSAGICRDLGEGGLAARMELCGRAEILLVTLPTFTKLLDIAIGYLRV